jgi:hypothetical protein
MKAKKALKRLNKVEALLSNVIDQCPTSKRGLRELLDSAKTAVVRARDAVNSQVGRRAARKPPVKAEQTQRSKLSAEGRKRISLAAKKRWTLAKRKGMNAVTGRPLRKTA